MQRLARNNYWVATILTLLVTALLWAACTKKNPVEIRNDDILEIFSVRSTYQTQLVVGGDQTTIEVVLFNQDNEIIPGRTVFFHTTLGTVTPRDTTNDDGVAQTILTSGDETGTAKVTISSTDVPSATLDVEFISQMSARISMNAFRQNLLANGMDTTRIYVYMQADSAKPIGGTAVALSASNNSVIFNPSVVTTDGTGRASLTVTSPSSNADINNVMITATSDTLTDSFQMNFRGVTFSIDANPDAIVADGESESLITVVLKETSTNVAIPDAVFTFSTDEGLIPNQATTDSRGMAKVTLTSSTTPDTARIVARYGPVLTQAIDVNFMEASASLFDIRDLKFSAQSMLGNGMDDVEITVSVYDEEDHAVPGDSVYFSSTAGRIEPEWVRTDNLGKATTRLYSYSSHADSTAQISASRGGGVKSISGDITIEGIDFDVVSSPDSILADGKSQAQVAVFLKRTTSEIAISDATVSFGTDAGTISNQAITDDAGVARVFLTSSTTPQTATVRARYGTLPEDSCEVVFSTQAPSTNALVEVTSEKSSMLANGLERSLIKAKVVDDQGIPVKNVSIWFEPSHGTVTPPQSETDNDGFASVYLTSQARTTDTTATVIAHLGTQTKTVRIDYWGLNFDMNPIPEYILADGRSTSKIRAVLKRTTGNVAVPEAVITFGTDFGSIPSSASTDLSGIAEVDLVSANSPGIATVQASYGPSPLFSITKQVEFQPSIPADIDLAAIPPVLPADGQSQATLRATVTDSTRNPVPDGTEVQFFIQDGGTGTVERYQSTVSGVAVSHLTSGIQPGAVNIIALCEGENYSLTDTVQVVYEVGLANQIIVESDSMQMMANGISTSNVRAQVMDAQGNPVPNVTVSFATTIGDITLSDRSDSEGVAEAQFSSSKVGIANITASVGEVIGSVQVRLLPGPPHAIKELTFDPHIIGVIETGQNSITTVEALVVDSKGNEVADGTYVTFSVVGNLDAPGGPGAVRLSSEDAIPTVGGRARVSCSSGIRSGAVRIKAEVTNAASVPVSPTISAISSKLIVQAGPPYIHDVDDPQSSHLTLAANRLNIWGTIDTTVVTVLVGDRYNNPVPEGTAVYLTTSGGVVTTLTHTDAYGMAKDTLITGNPLPTVTSFYNENDLFPGIGDPNETANSDEARLPGYVWYPDRSDYYLPNFEAAPNALGSNWNDYPGLEGPYPYIAALNSRDDTDENDGIARIVAYAQGIDGTLQTAKAWDWISVVFSHQVRYFDNSADVLLNQSIGVNESIRVRFALMDPNGNPIESGALITAETVPSRVQAGLSWVEFTTGKDQGQSYYYIDISNDLNPSDPQPGICQIKITWESDHQSGWAVTEPVAIIDNFPEEPE